MEKKNYCHSNEVNVSNFKIDEEVMPKEGENKNVEETNQNEVPIENKELMPTYE